ncbi:hypothetical protein JB92DRAFT_3129421 [Gautieria morchelliformis]|nr:hypothetical protein JB92DRAFT_3129421 [Gautieria morchelliformis]
MSTVRHLETSDTDDGIGALLDLAKRLQQVCPGLATLLEVATISGPPGSMGPEMVAMAHFLSQVAIDESVLQLVPPRTHPELGTVSHLVSPWIQHNAPMPRTVLDALAWLFSPPHEVWGRVLGGDTVIAPVKPIEPPDWRQMGMWYTQPPIRSRPCYPSLANDTRNEPTGGRGGKCSKYYASYKMQGLTGGIMCCWCTHSICYGFHCIPTGRDAMMCSQQFSHVGPLLPSWWSFFANTLFTVDDFHSGGHTKCSQASFLSTYAALDPRLATMNTSAAECGNGGLNRIRKGVSYMTQGRAIVYTQVFVSVWNRLKIQQMLAGSG